MQALLKNDLIIVAVVYLEKDYQQTLNCINATGLPVYYVQRKPPGVGSLAEAINRGFMEAGAIRYKYTWFVTNITFAPDVPEKLYLDIHLGPDIAAIHPAFDSDHEHLKPNTNDFQRLIITAPFIEFTAAMVDSKTFAENPLDEQMPYWGHDLDWGYQMHQQGKKMLVAKYLPISHTYIRNREPEGITIKRKQARKQTDVLTRQALQRKWGKDWEDIRFPDTAKQIGDFYRQVSSKHFI